MASPSRLAARPHRSPPSAAAPAAPSRPSLRGPVSVFCISKRVEWRRAVHPWSIDVNINVSCNGINHAATRLFEWPAGMRTAMLGTLLLMLLRLLVR